MYTDWVLIRRAAAELSATLCGARVQHTGQLADGRFAISLRQRGSEMVVAFDAFAATPVFTIEREELSIEADPGFVRRTGAALRAMTLLAVRTRTGDRVARLEFGTRSRFGVQSGYHLVAELVPKFGNLLLLKDDTIVTALKEFPAGRNARRTIETGARYEAPPLDLEPRGTRDTLADALAQHRTAAEVARIARAVRPLLPQLVAVSLATAAVRENGPGAADALLAAADAFLADIPQIATLPVLTYRENGRLVQAHVTALRQYDALEGGEEPELLPLLRQERSGALSVHVADRVEKRRRALARALLERQTKLRAEVASIEGKLAAAGEREQLRTSGEAIFASLHELDAASREEAKERAASLFSAYKKAGASVPHLQARLEGLLRGLAAAAELEWEVERASGDDLDDVAQAVAVAEGRPPAKTAARVASRKRKPLTILTPAGSRILIGRSPVENAELTFRVARPDDLWFHTQNIPGAHVILQRDDKAQPPEDDIAAAAAFAAYFSKAKNSPSVVVDYTHRKYVRKQPAAPPGLVYYTHPKSVAVAPRAPG